jgi:hypothetical protein
MGARTAFTRYGVGNAAYSFGSFAAGQLVGSVTRKQGPPIECEMVFLRADPENSGTIWIGGADVTSAVGYQLDAGDATGWIPIKQLDLIYYICENAADRLQYMIVG